MPPRRSQRDTSWHAPFLARVRDGSTYKDAATAVGISTKTLYNHFRDIPGFRSDAESAHVPRTYPMDTSWHDKLPPLIAAGLAINDAATVLGIHPGKIVQQLPRFPALRKAVEEARRRSGRARGMNATDPRRVQTMRKMAERMQAAPTGSLDLHARQVFIQALQAGATLKEAAAAIGTTPLTIKRTRYRDQAFDRSVVDAGGGRFTLLARPPCPGPKCGTPYAYDTLGCRETTCRTAATTRRTR